MLTAQELVKKSGYEDNEFLLEDHTAYLMSALSWAEEFTSGHMPATLLWVIKLK